MKKIFLTIVTILTTLIGSTAQDEMKISEQMARDLLSQMSSTTQNYKTIKLNFDVKMENKRDNTHQTTEGNLWVKGEKYVLDVFDMVTYNDQQTVCVWQRNNNEADISDPDPDAEGDMSPTKLFGAYKSGYKLRLLGDRKINGKQCTEIDLYPEDKKTNIIRLRISIDKQTNQICQFYQQTKSGEAMTISIKKFVTDSPIADSDFTFDTKKHPDVEVVDLR